MAAESHSSDSKVTSLGDDGDVAPAHVVTRLLKDLLEAIKAEDFESALLYCKKVLRFEPGNTLASRYLSICKKHVDGDSESDSDNSSDSEDGSSDDADSDSDTLSAGAQESKRAPIAAGAGPRRPAMKHK